MAPSSFLIGETDWNFKKLSSRSILLRSGQLRMVARDSFLLLVSTFFLKYFGDTVIRCRGKKKFPCQAKNDLYLPR